jgi:hypothetical protein
MRRRPDLIVPIRDRRQHKRYLTLRNFRNAIFVFLFAFLAISIHSELRGTDGSSFGRLSERELPPQVAAEPVEVVRETPPVAVADETHADPMLVAPMMREQWLRDDTTTAATTQFEAMPRAEASVATGRTRVAVVGDAGGVTIVQQERRKPVLSGGFGR